jgi:hypothetical protein
VDRAHREFFEDMGREFDGWVRVAVEAISKEDADLTWAGEAGPAISRLRAVLGTRDLVEAFEISIRKVLAGLLHSVMVSLDGGTQLANNVRLHLKTEDGQEMGPGLNELLFEHFHETGRLPARTSDGE